MTTDDRFQTLYRKYCWRVVRFYVSSFHLRQEDAEDLAQDAFTRFFQAMDEYRGDAEWAFFETIARNVAYNRIRSQKTAKRNARVVEIDDPGVTLDPPAPEEPDYAQREEEARRRKQLYDAIADLPPGQRECVQLWLDDLKYGGIAKFLRLTQDAVKSRLRDAKKTLRARLGDDHPLPEDEE